MKENNGTVKITVKDEREEQKVKTIEIKNVKFVTFEKSFVLIRAEKKYYFKTGNVMDMEVTDND